MTATHAVSTVHALRPAIQRTAALQAAKRELEPYYLDCLDDIAARSGIESGEVLLDALLGQMPVRKVRCVVIDYYRSRVSK